MSYASTMKFLRTGYAGASEYGTSYMAKKNAAEIAQYAKALLQVVQPTDQPPHWIRNKMSTIRAHMGDVKHYLEYQAGYAGDHYKPATMFRKNAFEVLNYATAVFNMIQPEEKVPQWVEHKLAVARMHMGEVKHYCEFMRSGYAGRFYRGRARSGSGLQAYEGSGQVLISQEYAGSWGPRARAYGMTHGR